MIENMLEEVSLLYEKVRKEFPELSADTAMKVVLFCLDFGGLQKELACKTNKDAIDEELDTGDDYTRYEDDQCSNYDDDTERYRPSCKELEEHQKKICTFCDYDCKGECSQHPY